ncbi:MAG: polysaccharide biosynthesis/export family protein [Bacteroidia bacterium]
MKDILIVLILLGFTGCSLKKDVVYVQNIDDTNLATIDSIFNHPLIEVNDILSIQISALDQNSVTPFRGPISVTEGNATARGYLVKADGSINFPVLGKLIVAGMSSIDLQLVLEDSLRNYIVNPVVLVGISNFKFTVLGGVSNPGTYSINEESINILQAIGMAGDIDIFGKRQNVLVIRQENGVRSTFRFDFTQSDWLNSPYYFIKQNDIIYIEPNFAKIKSAGMVSNLTELLRVVTVSISTYLLFTR